MSDPLTPNIGLAQPTRGSDVGTWDTPMNNNTTLLDLCVGGVATIGLNNSNVVLSAAQYQSQMIIFNSTLTGSVIITFPTTFIKSYVIQNNCTGSSQFTITMTTTGSSAQFICCPPGEIFEIVNTGTPQYKNFGRIGEYWEYSGSSVPAWVSGCSVPPYINCDGGSFSSAAYPALANILGGNTVPDSKGRVRATLNQGSGRMNSSNTGVDGNTLGAAGGSEFTQQHIHPFTGSSQTVNTNQGSVVFNSGSGISLGGGAISFSAGFASMTFTPGGTIGSSLTLNSSISGATGQSSFAQNMQPTYVGGLTLVRAA